MPPVLTAEPYATGVFGLGAASDSTPTLNHVERSPSARGASSGHRHGLERHDGG